MKKVRFLKYVKLVGRSDICCFSGDFRRIEQEVTAGETLDVEGVSYGSKVKARGGAYRLCTLVLGGPNFHTLHPDRYENVPSNVFEVLDD